MHGVTDDEVTPVGDDPEAIALLTWFAVDRLWQESQFREDDKMGCCHVCCGACSALYYLDRTGALDTVLSGAPEQGQGHAAIGDDGLLRRDWMHRMWDGTGVKQQACGHALSATESR